MPHLLPHQRSRAPRRTALMPAAATAFVALALTACTSAAT